MLRFLFVFSLSILFFACNQPQGEKTQEEEKVVISEDIVAETEQKKDALLKDKPSEKSNEIDMASFPEPTEVKTFNIKDMQKANRPDDPYRIAKKHCIEGGIYYRNQKYDSALFYMDSAVMNWPEKADYLIKRGLCKVKLEQYNSALTDYEKANELNPADKNILVNISQVYILEGDYKRAISFATKSIDKFPDYDLSYYNRGLAWSYLGEYQKGLDDFTKAIEINPEYAMALHNRGNTFYKLELFSDAAADWQQAADLGSEDAAKMLKIMNEYGIKTEK